ncbi:3-phenylpropionate-dihydrodiol/cinnamic acid-dihydrodiol dehydrogenase [Corynebacterium diphtheriae]|nr:3-phenylpropionate-dihydrodiol/cinnamic acid-dihydrodiol dehydrogenase [Corynebacterium diphtheriae]CAB0672253.1 3-phenylpropionate-dihydrodiol/cinnamic acid-dihydrodiol dehydrogenase [Corynebacterium diphtheriae]CAB0938990.1 3-phenylpropionate-dihydrodiol/cinnamic acid-dihydrodiol dehydrogenase [Corynebacterium diphtheriae]
MRCGCCGCCGFRAHFRLLELTNTKTAGQDFRAELPSLGFRVLEFEVTDTSRQVRTDLTPQRSPHPTYTLEMTNFSVVDKLALVTGSTRGLGRVLAQGLIEAGARVVVHGSDAQRAEAAVSEVIERFGAPDILVNNAGIQRRNPIEVFEDQDWDDIVGVNLSGVFHVTRPVASAMKAAGRGKIVMVGSVQSRLGRATIAPYCATKGGVAMFAQGLAAELSPFNVQVNTLSPGYFDTDMNAALVADEEFSGWVCKRTPAGRWGDPRELVGPLLFLASEASSFVTGQNLAVDGGMTAVV